MLTPVQAQKGVDRWVAFFLFFTGGLMGSFERDPVVWGVLAVVAFVVSCCYQYAIERAKVDRG